MKHTYLIVWLFISVSSLAQSRWQGSIAVGGLAASAEQTPLWLRANQYGTVPLQGSFATFRAQLGRDYVPVADSGRTRTGPPARRDRQRFDWGFGLYGVANVGVGPEATLPSSRVATYLPDAFVKFRLGKVELWAGNRREVVGLGDTLLTSGFAAWSGNAPTFPKVQVHTPGYVPLRFTKSFLAFRAGYAHGWYANTYVQGSFLHQKYAYLRFGKPTAQLHVTAGLNHQVQWGGYADYLIGKPIAVDGQLPSTFRDYGYVITGTYPEAFRNDRLTEFDGENRVGNHLGSIDFAVDWKRPFGHWQLYYQHYYEDASGLAFQNVPDGLTGLSYRRAPSKARFQVRRFVLEWLNTTDQSGSTFDITARYQGADNYFNHAQYLEGWSYRQLGIGTPLLATVNELGQTVRTYENFGYFPNNRVVSYYGAVQAGFAKGPVFTLRGSWLRGFGTYFRPYPTSVEQVSALLRMDWPVGTSFTLTTTAALDRGTFLPVSTGGYVGVQWSPFNQKLNPNHLL